MLAVSEDDENFLDRGASVTQTDLQGHGVGK